MGFTDALAERIIAVVGGLSCCGVGGCDSSPGCVVAVVDGLCAALALQAVAVGVGAVTVQGGAVFYFSVRLPLGS